METNYQQMNFDDCGFPYVHVTASGPVRELRLGDRVKMAGCAEAEKYAGRVWTVISEPWTVCGSRVVKLGGYGGGFDCERLELVER